MIHASEILSARVLIVDDQDANVRMLERLLGDAGYNNLTACRTAVDVCVLHRKHDYDLILLDLQMPGMDGFASWKLSRPATPTPTCQSSS